MDLRMYLFLCNFTCRNKTVYMYSYGRLEIIFIGKLHIPLSEERRKEMRKQYESFLNKVTIKVLTQNGTDSVDF